MIRQITQNSQQDSQQSEEISQHQSFFNTRDSKKDSNQENRWKGVSRKFFYYTLFFRQAEQLMINNFDMRNE